MGRTSNSTNVSDSGSHTQQLDFVVSIANMTWPGIAAVESGFANLTAAGMRTTNVLNSQMNLLSAGMMALGGTAALALGLMTAEAAKFEKQMTTVQSLIQNTGDTTSSTASSMAGLSSLAKEIALKYGESPNDVAKSMEALGRAGLTTASQMQPVLDAATQLAKIEGIDVDTAADYVVKMTNLFGGSYEQDSNQYATILAHAANISTTSATDIYNALKYAGGDAANIWGNASTGQRYQNAKDITAMIGFLSQQGVTGAYAGTSIRSFFQYIANPTSKSKKALAAVGLNPESLETVNPQNGETVVKQPMDILNTLNNAFNAKGMSDYQRLQWFQEWGQGKMGQNYAKLFSQGAENTSLQTYIDQMNEQYSMQDRVNTIMSSTAEQFNKLKSAVEVFGISVGETGLPILKAVTTVLADLANLLDKNQIAAVAFGAALNVMILGGLYSVAKWLSPLITTPLRDFKKVKDGMKEQWSQIKGTSTALGGEETAANGVATAMRKKADAKGKATLANVQLARSADNTAKSINKVQGEVTGASVATKKYTGLVQDLEKNHVPIVAENGSAADAKKMAELEESMTSGVYSENWRKKLNLSNSPVLMPTGLTGNKFSNRVMDAQTEKLLRTWYGGGSISGLIPFASSNNYEKHIEDLGKQIREQWQVAGATFPSNYEGKIKELEKINKANALPSFYSNGAGWTPEDVEKYFKEQDQIKEMAKKHSVGRTIDYGKLLNEGMNPAGAANSVFANAGAINWSQMSTIERMKARSDQITEKAGQIVDNARVKRDAIIERSAVIGRQMASKAKTVGTSALEWLGGLVGIGGVWGGAAVLGGAAALGVYYEALQSGYFDNASTKATKAMKNEQNYVDSLANKKNDLQKKIDTLTKTQGQYTKGSQEYQNIGENILNLTKEQTDATNAYNVANGQLVSDKQTLARINETFTDLTTTGYTNAFNNSNVEAMYQQAYGISSYSSSEAQTAFGNLNTLNGTLKGIQDETGLIKANAITGTGPYGNLHRASMKSTEERLVNEGKGTIESQLLENGYYYDSSGQLQQMDPQGFWTPFYEAYGYLRYHYWDKPIWGTDQWFTKNLGIDASVFPSMWKTWVTSTGGGTPWMVAGNAITDLLGGGKNTKNLLTNWANNLLSQTNSSSPQITNHMPITIKIDSILAGTAKEAENMLKNAVVKAANSLFKNPSVTTNSTNSTTTT